MVSLSLMATFLRMREIGVTVREDHQERRCVKEQEEEEGVRGEGGGGREEGEAGKRRGGRGKGGLPIISQ